MDRHVRLLAIILRFPARLGHPLLPRLVLQLLDQETSFLPVFRLSQQVQLTHPDDPIHLLSGDRRNPWVAQYPLPKVPIYDIRLVQLGLEFGRQCLLVDDDFLGVSAENLDDVVVDDLAAQRAESERLQKGHRRGLEEAQRVGWKLSESGLNGLDVLLDQGIRGVDRCLFRWGRSGLEAMRDRVERVEHDESARGSGVKSHRGRRNRRDRRTGSGSCDRSDARSHGRREDGRRRDGPESR